MSSLPIDHRRYSLPDFFLFNINIIAWAALVGWLASLVWAMGVMVKSSYRGGLLPLSVCLFVFVSVGIKTRRYDATQQDYCYR